VQHTTYVRPTRRGEYQPGCSCHWRILPCDTRQAANQWVQQHLHYAKFAKLTPYVYPDQCDTAA